MDATSAYMIGGRGESMRHDPTHVKVYKHHHHHHHHRGGEGAGVPGVPGVPGTPGTPEDTPEDTPGTPGTPEDTPGTPGTPDHASDPSADPPKDPSADDTSVEEDEGYSSDDRKDILPIVTSLPDRGEEEEEEEDPERKRVQEVYGGFEAHDADGSDDRLLYHLIQCFQTSDETARNITDILEDGVHEMRKMNGLMTRLVQHFQHVQHMPHLSAPALNPPPPPPQP